MNDRSRDTSESAHRDPRPVRACVQRLVATYCRSADRLRETIGARDGEGYSTDPAQLNWDLHVHGARRA